MDRVPFSRKTGDPAITIDQLHNVDLVLLSHHQHKDNFDHNGKKFAQSVPLILSTKPAEKSNKKVLRGCMIGRAIR